MRTETLNLDYANFPMSPAACAAEDRRVAERRRLRRRGPGRRLRLAALGLRCLLAAALGR
jgi:hypothetical protein